MVFTITNPHLLLAVYDEIFSLRSGSTRKPVVIGLRVAKRIEKIDISFLDTNLTSFGSTRKPICVRSSSSEAYREDRYNHSASFMMLCLLSIVVYGNAN